MLKRHYFAQYELLSKKILKYRKNTPPLKLTRQYEKVLSSLRDHLYQNKIYIPLPKYPYDPDDPRTHAFMRHVDIPTPIPNPDYKYKDIWVRVDGQKGIR